MSWLWKDKKTEQLKSVLHTSFEDDKKSTANRLTKIKNEAKSFKSHVEAAFLDSRVTTSMKGRKYVIDSLEEKTTDMQEKISSLRKWNCTELGLLESKEVNLEASLIELKSKNEELAARAEEKVQQITNIKEELTCNEQALHFSGRNPTQITSAHVGPPTSGSKAGGLKSHTAAGGNGGTASTGQTGGGGFKFSGHPAQVRQPTVTGWSTDDERIFSREAAKINLKWARRKRLQNRDQSIDVDDVEELQNNPNHTSASYKKKIKNPATEWWYMSLKLRNEFVHKVWDSTSGSVNTFEAVERHAQEWIKQEDAKYKKRQKVQKWREVQTKEKAERMRKLEEIRENVQDCKDCEKKVKTFEKMKANKEKLADWKEIKVMKDQLQHADNLVKTVAQFETQILQTKPKTLMKRPKSARNLLRTTTPKGHTFKEQTVIQPQKDLIEAFQQRDKEIVEKKREAVAKLEKAKTAPEIVKMPRPKILFEEKTGATYNKPTFSSARKVQAWDDPNNKYDFGFELDTQLLQIDNVPKLGLPSWKLVAR